MAVAFGQLRYPVALSVTWTREAKGLATGFGRQLVREKRNGRFSTFHSFICEVFINSYPSALFQDIFLTVIILKIFMKYSFFEVITSLYIVFFIVSGRVHHPSTGFKCA